MNVQSNRASNSQPLLESISTDRRRRILATLRDRDEAVDERHLATLLVSAEHGTEPEGVTPANRRAAHVDLAQVQLPALASADLIVRDEDAGTVTTADHPILEEPAFLQLLETESERWDGVIESLTDERRRVVLSVLSDRDDSVTMDDLAGIVAAREAAADPTPERLDGVRVSLHHVHLPKLDDAGLIEYDPEDETVVYLGHPDLDAAWFDGSAGGTPPVPPAPTYTGDA